MNTNKIKNIMLGFYIFITINSIFNIATFDLHGYRSLGIDEISALFFLMLIPVTIIFMLFNVNNFKRNIFCFKLLALYILIQCLVTLKAGNYLIYIAPLSCSGLLKFIFGSELMDIQARYFDVNVIILGFFVNLILTLGLMFILRFKSKEINSVLFESKKNIINLMFLLVISFGSLLMVNLFAISNGYGQHLMLERLYEDMYKNVKSDNEDVFFSKVDTFIKSANRGTRYDSRGESYRAWLSLVLAEAVTVGKESYIHKYFENYKFKVDKEDVLIATVNKNNEKLFKEVLSYNYERGDYIRFKDSMDSIYDKDQDILKSIVEVGSVNMLSDALDYIESEYSKYFSANLNGYLSSLVLMNNREDLVGFLIEEKRMVYNSEQLFNVAESLDIDALKMFFKYSNYKDLSELKDLSSSYEFEKLIRLLSIEDKLVFNEKHFNFFSEPLSEDDYNNKKEIIRLLIDYGFLNLANEQPDKSSFFKVAISALDRDLVYQAITQMDENELTDFGFYRNTLYFMTTKCEEYNTYKSINAHEPIKKYRLMREAIKQFDRRGFFNNRPENRGPIGVLTLAVVCKDLPLLKKYQFSGGENEVKITEYLWPSLIHNYDKRIFSWALDNILLEYKDKYRINELLYNDFGYMDNDYIYDEDIYSFNKILIMIDHGYPLPKDFIDKKLEQTKDKKYKEEDVERLKEYRASLN